MAFNFCSLHGGEATAFGKPLPLPFDNWAPVV